MNNKWYGAEIKIKEDGSVESTVTNEHGKQLQEIKAKNGKFNKIERKITPEGNTIEVTHSAWGNNFYHEDKKLEATNIKHKSINEEVKGKNLNKKRKLRSSIKCIIKELKQ